MSSNGISPVDLKCFEGMKHKKQANQELEFVDLPRYPSPPKGKAHYGGRLSTQRNVGGLKELGYGRCQS